MGTKSVSAHPEVASYRRHAARIICQLGVPDRFHLAKQVDPFEGRDARGERRGKKRRLFAHPSPLTPRPSFPVTLTGEIVDSKCFLGVMNPGQLTPHRACAIRCISGGCPPVLLVRQKDRPPLYFLLVSADGKPVNKPVLEMVALPVEISSEVARQGNLLILRADPATYRRL